MLFRRFAVAAALLVGAAASQLPEYTQQYRQRLGGAVDELQASLVRFDADSAAQSLTRNQGIARLKSNPDPLAQARGDDVDATAERFERLRTQRDAFTTAGPLSQYAVLAEDLDGGVARGAYAEYQPALPMTAAGLIAAACGFALGWMLLHLGAMPFRRRDPLRIAEPRIR